MTISTHLLQQGHNRCVVAPAWITLNEWLDVLASNPIATPLVDFGREARYRVGVSTLNWFLMDMLGLRTQWLDDGWQKRDDPWLLINPLRYRLLGHQPKRPFPYDVRDYLREHHPGLLNRTLKQLPYFALAPTVRRDQVDDVEAQRRAAAAPWSRLAVLDEQDYIIGMVWHMGATGGSLPPIMGRLDISNMHADS